MVTTVAKVAAPCGAAGQLAKDAGPRPRITCACCGARLRADELPYACDVTALPEALAAAWHDLEPDEAIDVFLRACALGAGCQGWARDCFAGLLRAYLSAADANALAGRGEMFVLSTAQARRLLGGRRPGGLLLDVGAGCGEVTSQFLPLFDAALTTEASLPALWRLRARGLPALRTAAGLAPPHFDAAAAAAGVALGPSGSVDCALLLNVLDRCDAPLALLREVCGRLQPGKGLLVLALVLPYRPFVDRGARGRGRPSEFLPLPPGASWEASVALLWRQVLQPAGLELEALARAPYLSQGDALSPAYALDDAIFVLRRGRDG